MTDAPCDNCGEHVRNCYCAEIGLGHKIDKPTTPQHGQDARVAELEAERDTLLNLKARSDELIGLQSTALATARNDALEKSAPSSQRGKRDVV